MNSASSPSKLVRSISLTMRSAPIVGMTLCIRSFTLFASFFFFCFGGSGAQQNDDISSHKRANWMRRPLVLAAGKLEQIDTAAGEPEPIHRTFLTFQEQNYLLLVTVYGKCESRWKVQLEMFLLLSSFVFGSQFSFDFVGAVFLWATKKHLNYGYYSDNWIRAEGWSIFDRILLILVGSAFNQRCLLCKYVSMLFQSHKMWSALWNPQRLTPKIDTGIIGLSLNIKCYSVWRRAFNHSSLSAFQCICSPFIFNSIRRCYYSSSTAFLCIQWPGGLASWAWMVYPWPARSIGLLSPLFSSNILLKWNRCLRGRHLQSGNQKFHPPKSFTIVYSAVISFFCSYACLISFNVGSLIRWSWLPRDLDRFHSYGGGAKQFNDANKAFIIQ